MRYLWLLPALGLCVVSAACGRRGASSPPPPPLRHFVPASLVKSYLEQERPLLLVDVRRAADYETGHLPSSVSLPLSSVMPGPLGALKAERRREMGEALRKAGVRLEIPAVIIDEGSREGFRRAAITCWVLALAGQDDCHVLEGGLGAWTAAGGKLVRVRYAPVKVAISSTEIPPDPPAYANLEAVRQASVEVGVALADVRTRARFREIPGAYALPLEQAVSPEGRVDRKTLDLLTTGSGVLAESEVIVLGEDLREGAAGWFLLARGTALPRVRLFPGGFRRYRTFPNLPLRPIEPDEGGAPGGQGPGEGRASAPGEPQRE